MIRVLLLILRMSQAYPTMPLERVIVASARAADAETEAIPAELLLAIAEHESDLRPRSISYVRAGSRVDLVEWTDQPTPPRIVCGYLSAMGSRAQCKDALARDGGMTLGAAELNEWATTCRGDTLCALRGHAGGNSPSPRARAFASLFYRRAMRLGWKPVRPAT